MTNPYLDLLQAQPAGPGAAPDAPANPYLTSLQSEEDQRQQALAGQLTQAVGVNPDQYNAKRRVAQYLGYPTAAVEALPQLEQQAKVQQTRQTIANAPTLQRKYADADFAKLAHDDAPVLAQIEDFIGKATAYVMGATPSGGMGGALKRGVWDNSVVGAAGAFRMVSEVGAAAAEAVVPGVQAWEASGKLGGNPLRRLAEGFAKIGAAQQASKDAATPDAAGNFAAGVESGFESAGQNAKYLPLAFMGPPGWAAALTGMVVETGGLTYQKDREEGVPLGTATLHAGADMLAEYVGERYFGEVGFLKRLAAGAPASKLMMWELTREVPGEIGTTLWQNFNDWTLTNPSKPVSEFLREQPDAIAQTAIATLVGGTAQAGAGRVAVKSVEAVLNRQMEITSTLQREDALKELMAQAAQSKLAERSPEQLKAFVDDASGGAQVRFDAATLVEVFNQSSVPIQQALPSVNLQELQEMAATGGEVSIPMGELVAGTRGSGIEQTILEHARLADSTLSAAEAREVQGKLGEDMKVQADRVIAQAQDQAAARASQDAVKENLKAQIVATGRVRDSVADGYATWAASFYTAYGSRMGMTAEEMLKAYPLRVLGEAPVGGESLAQGGGPTVTDRVDEGTGLPLNSDGTVTVWHHTSRDKADAIAKSGKLKAAAEPDVYVTTRRETDTGYGDTAVAIRVKPEMLRIDDEFPDGRIDYRISAGKPGGSVRVAVGEAPNTLAQGQSAPRGTFNPNTLDLVLNPNANLSTWFHETGHFFLEVLADVASQPGAPAQIVEDMNTFLKWAGITGDEAVGGAGSGAPLAQSGEAADAIYQEIAADNEVTDALELWMVDGKVPSEAMNDRLLGYMRRLPPIPRDAYLTFYRGQPRDAKPHPRGWASWTTNKDETRFFTDSPNSEVLTRKGVRGISLEEVALWKTRATGQRYDYGSQGEWLVLNESVFSQEGAPTPEAPPIQPKRTPLETWRAMTLDQQRPYHERWAESVEQYVMEGRAPSVELQPMMRRFSAWLKSVYGSIKQFLASRGQVSGQGTGALDQGAGPQTETPEFKRWFGDSKVVDAQGKPLVVYHGTAIGGFDVFKPNVRKGEQLGFGIHFAVDQQFAELYANDPLVARKGKSPRVYATYLKAEKPLLADTVVVEGTPEFVLAKKLAGGKLFTVKGESGKRTAYLQNAIDATTPARAEKLIREAGYDAVRYVSKVGTAGVGARVTAKAQSWIVFSPTQIKSATGNDGTFDANDPSILSQDPNAPAGPDLQLNDDIRRVMDRMLATDEQIAQANEVAGLMPDENADAEAQERLRKRSIADLKWAVKARDKALAKLRKSAKGIEKSIRADVEAEVEQMPEVLAAAALSEGKAPEVVADAFGYASADAMLQAIDAFGSPRDAIDGMTERRMLEEHGDLIDDRAIEAAANEAVHNEARARSLATELRTQREMLGGRESVQVDDDTRAILAATQPISLDDARALVSGKTEKPGGVDPLTWLKDKDNYRIGDVPLDLFVPNEEGDRYDGTVNPERAQDYAGRDPAGVPPVIAAQGRKANGKLRILDGGHRISAARARGDTTIRALVRTNANMDAEGNRVTSKGSRVTVNALVEAAKQFGANVVSRTPLRDLKSKAWQHTAAERRASKRWAEATAAGKTVDAVKAKQDQMLNHAAAKAALDAETEATKIREFFARVAKGNDEETVKKGRDADIVNAARAVLAEFGVETATTKRADDYLDAVKTNDPETWNAIEPMVREATQNAQPLDALTFDELQGLNEQIHALWHLAKRSRQMEVDGDLIDIGEAAQDIFTRLEEIGIPDTIPGEVGALTKAEERARWLQFAGALLRRVEQWTEKMDGKFGGPFNRLLFQPIKDAATRYRADHIAYRAKFQALVDQVAPSMTHTLIEAPELGYTFGRGHNGIGHAELLHAILHTGNESNKRKLLLGRRWATENADGTLDTSKWDAFINRLANAGVLQQAHFDFAQGVWGLMESTKPLAQKTHRDVFGRYFAEVTANPFVDPFGVTRSGGYVPAQADPTIVTDASLRALTEMENESMAFSFPATSKGFTKSRVEYNRPLKLDLRTLPQHIDKVLLFSHMEPAVRGAAKLLRQKKVSQPLNRVAPAAYDGMLLPWLNRSARQQVETPIVGDGRTAKILSTLRSRAGAALMFANVSNTVQQITGVVSAGVKVAPSQLLRAAVGYVQHPQQMTRAVTEASEFMRVRMDNSVQALDDEVKAILTKPNLYERAQDWTQRHAYFLQQAFDNVLSPIVWTGAYNDALAQGMDERMAIRFADGTVRQTQGALAAEDVSRIETGPAYARVFTQFISYFNMMANTNLTALQQINREMGIPARAARASAIVTLGFLLPIWIAEAIAVGFKGGPGDADGDGDADTLVDWLAAVLGMGTIKGLLAQVPFVGTLANSAVARFNGNPADDKMSLSPAVSMLEAAAGVPSDLYKIAKGEGNARTTVRDVASLLTLATGLPLTAAARPLGYAAGVADDRTAPTGPADAARGMLTGVPSPASKVQ